MHSSDRTNLTAQIARVGTIDPNRLQRLHHEALTVPGNWIAEYGDYQSGGWWTTSLMNGSGNSDDVIIRDCRPVATELLQRMPHTRQLLDELDLRFMYVRLARLSANSFLWEHSDYGELDDVERYRLHIPLATNSSAYLVLGGAKVHLSPGWIWRLTPTFEHGACNLFGPDRIHLIVDCYAEAERKHLTDNAAFGAEKLDLLPVPSEPDLSHHMTIARDLKRLGYQDTAETYLLRLFYRYTLPAGRVYDLIADLHQSTASDDAAETWRMKKSMMLGVSQ
jgi:hypothetical protein